MHRFIYNVLKDMYVTRAGTPTVTDDGGKGFAPGSRWINTLTSPASEWVCVDNHTGAAVWIQVGGEGGGGGGGGEANTASNQGLGGVGLFLAKSGVDLQFKNLAPAAGSVLTVTNNGGNKTVDLDVPNMTGANGTTAGTKGLVPAPNGTDNLNFLRGDATWQSIAVGESNTASNVGTGGQGLFKQKSGVDLQFRNVGVASNKLSVALNNGSNRIDLDVVEANLSDMVGSNGSVGGTHGLVPAPVAADNVKFLRGDGTWATVTSGVSSVNTRTGAVTLVGTDIPAFVASGSSHAAGAVPDPGSSAGTTKFLREDATWQVPAYPVTSVNTRTGAVTLVGTDIPAFVASGGSHAAGAVPDPGSSSGTTKFLREDATWAVPYAAPTRSWAGFINQPLVKTYTIELSAPAACHITALVVQTVSGSCTLSAQIGGVDVTSISGVTADSTLRTYTQTGLNAVAATNKVTLNITAVSSPVDLAFSLQYTEG